MPNTSIVNLISQSTAAIAGAAGQTHRFSQLVTQPHAEGSALRVAAQSGSALSIERALPGSSSPKPRIAKPDSR